MPIEVTCASCGTKATVPDSAAGRTGKCRRCGQQVRVPIPQLVGAADPVVDGSTEETAPVKPASKQKPISRSAIVLVSIAILLVMGGVFGWQYWKLRQANNKQLQVIRQSADYDRQQAAFHHEEAQQHQQMANAADHAANARYDITGDVWVEKGNGEPLSVVAEEVLLVPRIIKLDPKGEPQLAQSLQSNEYVINKAGQSGLSQDAIEQLTSAPKNVLGRLKPLVAKGEIPTEIAVWTSWFSLPPHDPDMWAFIQHHAVAHADTDREGKFTLKQVPAGEYTVVCRAYKPTWDRPIFWAVDLDCPQDSKIELTPKNLYHGLGG